MRQAEHPEHPVMQNWYFGTDVTKSDLVERIPKDAWDQVMASAKILQEENDVPFSRGNLIVDPHTREIYEVCGVYDNRHRDAVRGISLECRREDRVVVLPASGVMHLGYLIEAFMPYSPNVTYIMGGTSEERLHNLSHAVFERLAKNAPQAE
jgi:hypothetical protein